jgi:hypothetical protein
MSKSIVHVQNPSKNHATVEIINRNGFGKSELPQLTEESVANRL